MFAGIGSFRIALAATATVLLMAGQLIGASSASDVRVEATDLDAWTILAYMSADVPGSPLNWSQDINEMEAGLNSETITVLALVDPPGSGNSRVYKIAHETPSSDNIVSSVVPYPPLNGTGEVNMGDPATLVGFAEFSIDEYSQGGRVGVILWGHGDGWAGVCQDNADHLSPEELVTGLQAVRDHIGKPLDLVAFDACSMGSIEVLSALSGIASYSVSSEILVSALGYPYDAVLARISSDPGQGGEGAGRAFADEFVKFGALMANVTSQAAVMNLTSLGIAVDSFRDFSNLSARFVPVAKSDFLLARNRSAETDGISTIDLQTYLIALSSDARLPRRLAQANNHVYESITGAVSFNRVFISLSDYDTYAPSALHGLSIFMPRIATPLSAYENTSGLAEDWGGFLSAMFSNVTYPTPDAYVELVMSDRRFSDGLMDTVSVQWDETPQITEWEVDVILHGGLEGLASNGSADNATPRTIEFGDLQPDSYDVGVYGIDANGTYWHYRLFDSVVVMKRYQFTVLFPQTVSDGMTSLEILNLRTGETDSIAVSGGQVMLTFDVPGKHQESDNILVQLKRGNETLAWGMLTLSGDNAELSMTAKPGPSALTAFVLTLLISAILGFAAIKLLGIGRGRSGTGRLDDDTIEPSTSDEVPEVRAEPSSPERVSSVRDEEGPDIEKR